MGITEVLRIIWLFSANNIKSSESFSKQPTQLIIKLNSSFWHIIVTMFCADTPSGPIKSSYNATKISQQIGDNASFANAKTSFAQFFSCFRPLSIRTVSSYSLLSALLNRFQMVYGPIRQSTCNSIYDQTC